MLDRRFVAFLFISGAAFAQWTPQLSIRVKTVTSAVPSADGRLAVWTETHPVMDGEKRVRTGDIGDTLARRHG